MKFVSRLVDATDVLVMNGIRAMARDCFPEGTLNRLGDTPGTGHWWVTWCDGKVAAFAGLKPSYQIAGRGYLALSGVLPAYRGHGLQKRLIRLRLRKARALGWRDVVTETIDNPVSANNLIACGFRMFEPEVRWNKSPDTAYWRRTL